MKGLRYAVFVVLAFSLIFSFFFAFFAWCAYQHYHSKAIDVEKIQLSDFVNFTSEVEEYPVLQKALKLADGEVELNLSPGEFFELEEAINTTHIEVEKDYYRINLFKRVGVLKLDDVPENYTKVSKKELESYPSIKKAISHADLAASHSIRRMIYSTIYSREEFNKTKEFVNGNGGKIIEFEGGYYEVVVERLNFPRSSGKNWRIIVAESFQKV